MNRRAEELFDADRRRALALVERHGWNATAFQTVEPGYTYFFHDDACVAYVDTGSAWVAAGAPIARGDALHEVASAFLRAARARGRRCCFVATEDRFCAALSPEFRTLKIGEQPVWDPCDWPEILASHPSLREQLRRARAKGVRVREADLAGDDRAAVGRIAERWHATHGMAPMGFLVRVNPFDLLAYRPAFVAAIDGRIVGFACVVPVPARDGWFVEHIIRDPLAPNGTAELLVDRVMHWAADTGRRWLTLGLAPLAGSALPGALRFVRRFAAPLYDFAGLERYKAKLRPRSWSSIHLAYPVAQSAPMTVVDALAAFTRGGFLRFGLESLVRGPMVVLQLLAVVLVPWTVALVLAPTERWFGLPWVKWAWVVFDLIVALGMFRLVTRPRSEQRRLLDVLAIAVTMDAVVTLAEALAWNARHTRSLVDALVVFVACAAPAFAALVLWGARARVRRIYLCGQPF
jgi:phosphatidylglycerol lysyltransferase